MTDCELVDRARRGDAQAWAALVERHHAAVYRAAFAALLRGEDADDAAQDAWIAAWQRLDAFRGDASFRTWLLAIAWRKALDRRRSAGRWLSRLGRLSRNDAGDDDLADVPDVAQLTAEQRALDGEARRRVRRALRGLSKPMRDCLLLAAAGDATYEEIGQMLGIPVGTVKWRVNEARKRLQVRLDRL